MENYRNSMDNYEKMRLPERVPWKRCPTLMAGDCTGSSADTLTANANRLDAQPLLEEPAHIWGTCKRKISLRKLAPDMTVR